MDDLMAWEQAMLARGGGTHIQITDNHTAARNDQK